MILKKKNRQQELVEKWNRENEIGTEVEVTLDNETTMTTKTISRAALLGGHTAVIWVKGISGCYRLDRVKGISGCYKLDRVKAIKKKELATETAVHIHHSEDLADKMTKDGYGH